jgi:hypothetical protein
MTSKPPTQDLFPQNWDLEDEGAGATREIEADELFARAGIGRRPSGNPPPAPSSVPPPPPAIPRPSKVPRAFVVPRPPPTLLAAMEDPSPPTVPPPMPPEEYVEHMMRMAPSSEGGLTPLSTPPEEPFGTLTPWPASVPPEHDPSSLSNLLFEANPGALNAGKVPSDFEEDMGRTGSAALTDLDLAELVPELARRKLASSAPPRGEMGEMDDLDELLNDEVKRVVRKATVVPPPRAKSKNDAPPSSDFGLDLSFDDPVFASGSGPPARRPSAIALDAVDPMTLELDDEPDRAPRDPLDDLDDLDLLERREEEREHEPTKLPAVTPMPPAVEARRGPEPLIEEPFVDEPFVDEPRFDDEGIEPAPDTMVEATPFMGEYVERDTSSMQARLERVRARFEVGDFGGALMIAEGMLDEEPRHLPARCYVDACRAVLREMYMARMGDKSKVLRVTMTPAQIKHLALDHRAGFLLSCVDGTSSVDEILDVCGMQALDALRILYELMQEGAIEAEVPSSRQR